MIKACVVCGTGFSGNRTRKICGDPGCKAEASRRSKRKWDLANPDYRFQYRAANRETLLEKARSNRNANIDAVRDYDRARSASRRALDIDKYREISRRSAAKQRAERGEEISKSKRTWYEANLDKVRAQGRDWAERNPDKMKAKHARRCVTRAQIATRQVIAQMGLD